LPDRTVALYRLGAALARSIPAPVADAAARLIGVAVARRPSDRRLIVERNLRRVHGQDFGGPELRRAVQHCYASYARYYAESFRLPTLSAEKVDAGISVDGYEHLEAALAAGKGAIMALPHLGGWEWAGFWLTRIKGIPVSVVVERVEPPELFDWFVDLRRSFGFTVLPLGPSAGTAVARALKDNHVVALLCDRDIGGGGMDVDFFGERTTLPAGPATLAMRTGAPLLPTAIYFRGRGHHAVVRPPVPVERTGRLRADAARITQDLAHELEELIRVAPDQWHLMQPNWPSDHDALAARR
jgi:KDO2-lipid IV(A) lauroyltransferase